MGGRKRGTRIREVCCTTEHKFLDAISPRSRYFDEGEPHRVLFRGHADARFQLLPSAFRAKWERPPTNEHQVSFELEAVQNFFWLADQCGLPLPEDSQIHRRDLFSDVGNFNFPLREEGDLLWPPREIWSLLALAQHHGLPTQLCAGPFATRRRTIVVGFSQASGKEIGRVPLELHEPDNPNTFVSLGSKSVPAF